MGADETAYYIQDSADTDSALSISTTRVGIGTDVPATLLHLESTDDNEPILQIKTTHAGNHGGMLKFSKISASEADDDELGDIGWYGYDSGNNETRYGLIRASSTDITDGDEGGKIQFYVHAGGTAGTAADKELFSIGGEDVANGTACAVVINEAGIDSDFRVEASGEANALFVQGSDGAVGIGTAAPLGKIHAVSSDVSWSAPAYGDEIIAENNGDAGISIVSSNDSYLVFSNANRSGAYSALIWSNYNSGNDYLAMNTAGGGEVMRLDHNGNVGIGKTPDGSVGTTGVEFIGSGGDKGRMILSGDTAALIGRNLTGSTSQPVINWYRQTTLVGSVSVTDTSTAYNTSSDYRLKENEVLITDGLERLNQLKPYRFNFKVNPDNIVDGFFAHEVSSIVPESISGEKDAMIDEEVSPAIEAVEAVEAQDAVYETVTLQRQVVVVSEVEEEVSSTEIVLEDGKYVQKTTTEMVTKEVSEPQWEDVPLYGEDGEQLMRLVSEAIEAKEAVLDEDGNETEEAVDAQDAVYEGITHRIPEMEEYDEEQLVSESVEAVEAVEGQDAVSESVPDYQGIDQAKLVPLLVAAIQELSAKVEALENK